MEIQKGLWNGLIKKDVRRNSNNFPGLACPTCDGKTKVVETRKGDQVVYRTRRCSEGHRFITEERVSDM